MRSIFAPYCNLIEARDGQEALKLCESHAPDLIISDVMMPIVSMTPLHRADHQMDGFGLLSALKSSPKFKIIPVIML
jgi:CheY-like chemotaxis protein